MGDSLEDSLADKRQFRRYSNFKNNLETLDRALYYVNTKAKKSSQIIPN